MTKERNINSNVVAAINGYTIVRSETRKFDTFTGEIKGGQTKVYYDVCDKDEELLESFKTLREAKRFCEA